MSTYGTSAELQLVLPWPWLAGSRRAALDPKRLVIRGLTLLRLSRTEEDLSTPTSSSGASELDFCFSRLTTSVGYDGDYQAAEEDACILLVSGYTERQCQSM